MTASRRAARRVLFYFAVAGNLAAAALIVVIAFALLEVDMPPVLEWISERVVLEGIVGPLIFPLIVCMPMYIAAYFFFYKKVRIASSACSLAMYSLSFLTFLLLLLCFSILMIIIIAFP